MINKYNINYTKENKTNMLDAINNYYKNNIYENIKYKKCNEINIINIGINIKDNFNDFFKNDIDLIDIVLIENQIGPIATRMNNIQGMITQYFIMNNLFNIQYISANNKLKKYLSNKKTTYSERKKLSIDIAKNELLNINNDENEKEKIINYFNNNKKKMI